jgi:hypothetical protein
MATTTCVVIGAEGVGKTGFISKYLYNYLPGKYVPSKHPKVSTYKYNFPPPGILLEILESTELPDKAFSSAILLYNPLEPYTLEYIEKIIILIKERSPREIGIIVAGLVNGHNKQGKGRALANKYKAHFIIANLNNRNSIKNCFNFAIQWGKKNPAWEARKPFLLLREKLKTGPSGPKLI